MSVYCQASIGCAGMRNCEAFQDYLAQDPNCRMIFYRRIPEYVVHTSRYEQLWFTFTERLFLFKKLEPVQALLKYLKLSPQV